MKWPRGKYNGRRIGGIEAKLKINILWWIWLPAFSNIGGQIYIHWLCFYSWWSFSYE